MKTKMIPLICGALFAGLFAGSAAVAAQIPSGQLNTGGIVTLLGAQGMTLNQATGLDFFDPQAPIGPGALVGTTGSGAFAGLDCTVTGDAGCGFIKDILDFGSFTNSADFIVTISGVRFQLNSPLSIVRAPATGNSLATLIVSGNGLLNFGQFDATPGRFTLVTQGTNTVQTTYAASIVALPRVLPEPASLMLLGIGIAGVIGSRRKSR